MRAPARATEAYLLVAMLAAAAAGRLLDATGVLPGVHEGTAVRGAGIGWATALLTAAVVAVAGSRRWSRTQSLAATAAVVVPGQLVVFLCAEAGARVAGGAGPVDPDGLVGALLQAGLAGLLLLALSLAAAVLLRCGSLSPSSSLSPDPRPAAAHDAFVGLRTATLVEPRGPPAALGC